MDGQRQAQTFSLLSSFINSSARRASVKDEVSMMTKTNGVNKARFLLEQQPQPTDPGAFSGLAEDNPLGCKSVFFVFLPSRFRAQSNFKASPSDAFNISVAPEHINLFKLSGCLK